MINFNDWPVRTKLTLPLLLVMILGSVGIIAAFDRVFETTTRNALPEERALNGIRQSSLQLLAEYREFVIAPSDSTLREIDELKEDIEGFERAYEKLSRSDALEAKFVAEIEDADQDFKRLGDEAIGLRLRLQEQIGALEGFESFFEDLPVESPGEDGGPSELAHEFLAEIREFALVPGESTRAEIAAIERSFDRMFANGSGGSVPGTGDQTANAVAYGQYLAILEAGRATVSLADSFQRVLETLEESEERLLEVLEEATVVVARETDQAFLSGFLQIGVVILVVLLLITAVGYFVSQRIARPVMILADAANRLGEGDLSVRTDVASADEIGDLANAFNQMAENLQSNIERREQAEEQLRQSQKMEAVGQLTGGVAHDFNNLLAIILGNAELLSEELEGEKADRLEPMIRAATRGAELTDRLLAFSRKQALRPRPVDLAELIEDMRGLLTRSLGATIEIETVAAPDAWNLMADPGQLENAVLNLAINARDAMPDGGKLTIEWANAVIDEDFAARNPGADVGDYVAIAIADTGFGMSEEALEHAFEPFFTTKPVGEGTGLGLSMVYGFAKQSDGYVTLHSEEGKGTMVKLYLPRAGEATDRNSSSAASQLPAGDGEVVLVLEDDADVRNLVVKILGRLDYRVIEAPDARAALSVLSAGEKIDLLLSDVVLPGGISGPELAQTARESDPALKVMFMSGYSDGALNGNGQLSSDAVVLSKPFPSRELAEKVRTALGR